MRSLQLLEEVAFGDTEVDPAVVVEAAFISFLSAKCPVSGATAFGSRPDVSSVFVHFHLMDIGFLLQSLKLQLNFNALISPDVL